jgi:transposase InsO family protein
MWFTHVYFIRQKSEVLDKFKRFKNFIENQKLGFRIRGVRSDGGGEYSGGQHGGPFHTLPFHTFLLSNGISHDVTPPYTPQLNGVAEGVNRTLLSCIRALLFAKNLPLRLWGEALSHAVFLKNRSPTRSLPSSTPFQVWFGFPPNLSDLHVFGCVLHVFLPEDHHSKLDSHSLRATFTGFTSGEAIVSTILLQTKFHLLVMLFPTNLPLPMAFNGTSQPWMVLVPRL